MDHGVACCGLRMRCGCDCCMRFGAVFAGAYQNWVSFMYVEQVVDISDRQSAISKTMFEHRICRARENQSMYMERTLMPKSSWSGPKKRSVYVQAPQHRWGRCHFVPIITTTKVSQSQSESNGEIESSDSLLGYRLTTRRSSLKPRLMLDVDVDALASSLHALHAPRRASTTHSLTVRPGRSSGQCACSAPAPACTGGPWRRRGRAARRYRPCQRPP